MNSLTRQRAIRCIVASIIGGAFSSREIDEISDALMRPDDFAAEVGRGLHEVARCLLGPGKLEPVDRHSFGTQIEDLISLVRRSGVTQRRLLETIARRAPDLGRSLGKARLSTAELIERLYRESPESALALAKELEHLGNPPGNDPYLELISKRLDK